MWRYLKTLGHIFQRNVGLPQIPIPRSETHDLICVIDYSQYNFTKGHFREDCAERETLVLKAHFFKKNVGT